MKTRRTLNILERKGPEVSKLIGMKQICEFVSFSESTVLKWIRESGFPAHKLNDARWISEAGLIDQWWCEVSSGKHKRPDGVSSREINKNP